MENEKKILGAEKIVGAGMGFTTIIHDTIVKLRGEGLSVSRFMGDIDVDTLDDFCIYALEIKNQNKNTSYEILLIGRHDENGK